MDANVCAVTVKGNALLLFSGLLLFTITESTPIGAPLGTKAVINMSDQPRIVAGIPPPPPGNPIPPPLPLLNVTVPGLEPKPLPVIMISAPGGALVPFWQKALTVAIEGGVMVK